MGTHYTDIRKPVKPELPVCVIYPESCIGQRNQMFTTRELLDRLERRGIKKSQVARLLGVSPSRVTEMHKGERAIKLDEAARLVSEFELEEQPSPKLPPLPAPIARLVVAYVAAELGLAGNSDQIEEIAQDIRAFAEFVADPSVRESLDAAETFFQAMRLRRPKPESTNPLESDPLSAN